VIAPLFYILDSIEPAWMEYAGVFKDDADFLEIMEAMRASEIPKMTPKLTRHTTPRGRSWIGRTIVPISFMKIIYAKTLTLRNPWETLCYNSCRLLRALPLC
jgi:hypothetical protein